jgi:hypothetical protein
MITIRVTRIKERKIRKAVSKDKRIREEIEELKGLEKKRKNQL